MKVVWSQPLCEPCWAAWTVGRGEVPRTPIKLVGDPEVDGDPCLVCGTPTLIYARIDPEIAAVFANARVEVTQDSPKGPMSGEN